jgi:hypothetical protein
LSLTVSAAVSPVNSCNVEVWVQSAPWDPVVPVNPCYPIGHAGPKGPFIIPNPGISLKLIGNALADCIYAVDIKPVNNAIVNNNIIDEFIFDFINFIYIL